MSNRKQQPFDLLERLGVLLLVGRKRCPSGPDFHPDFGRNQRSEVLASGISPITRRLRRPFSNFVKNTAVFGSMRHEL
jgi:hypothetical protein